MRDAAGRGCAGFGRGAEERGEGLGDDELAGDVHFELAAEEVDVDVEEGAGIGDAGIVDEAEERPSH